MKKRKTRSLPIVACLGALGRKRLSSRGEPSLSTEVCMVVYFFPRILSLLSGYS